MKSNHKKIRAKINSLTSNEDFRQDLWVAHLSGQQQLTQTLQQIQQTHRTFEKFQEQLRQISLEELDVSTSQILNTFDGIHRNILYLVILGYSMQDICNHYGTSMVRVQQALAHIQKHSVWDKLSTSV